MKKFSLFSMLDQTTTAALEAQRMSLASEEKATIPPLFIAGLECTHSRGVAGYKGSAAAVVREKAFTQLSPMGNELVSRLLGVQRILTALGATDAIADVELPVRLSRTAVRRFTLPAGWDMGVNPELLIEEAKAVQADLIGKIQGMGEKLTMEVPFYEVVDFCFSSRPAPLEAEIIDGNVVVEKRGPEDKALHRMIRDTTDRRCRAPKDGVWPVSWLQATAKQYPFLNVKREGDKITIRTYKSRRTMRILPRNVREIDQLRLVRMIITDYDGGGENAAMAYEVSIPARADVDPANRDLLSEEVVQRRVVGWPILANMRPSWARVLAENFAGIPPVYGMNRQVTNVIFALAGEAFRTRLTALPGGGKRYFLPRPDQVSQAFEEVWSHMEKAEANAEFKEGLRQLVEDLKKDAPFIRASQAWIRSYFQTRAREAGLLPAEMTQLRAGDIPGLQEKITPATFWVLWPLLLNYNAPEIPVLEESANRWLATIAGSWPVLPDPAMVSPYRYTGEIVEELFARLDARFMSQEPEAEQPVVDEAPLPTEPEATLLTEPEATLLTEPEAEQLTEPEATLPTEPEPEIIEAKDVTVDDIVAMVTDAEAEMAVEAAVIDAAAAQEEELRQIAEVITGGSDWKDFGPEGLAKLLKRGEHLMNVADEAGDVEESDRLAEALLRLEEIQASIVE